MPRLVRPSGRVVVTAAGAAALVLALPSAAYASHHPKPKQHKTFAAHGLVLRHTSSSVTLLASTTRTGKHSRHNTPVTVALPSRHTAAGRALAKRLAKTHTGDGITVVGTSTSGRVTAKNFAVKPAPFHVYAGRITAINDALITVAKGPQSSDDAREGHRGHFTIDSSEAAVSLDGQSVDSALDLSVGDTVLALGSSVDDVVVATSVFGISLDIDVLTGRVTAVNDPLITVDAHDRRGPGGDREHALSMQDGDGSDDGDGGDDGDSNGVVVSLDSAAVIVDGTSNATVSSITPGSRVLALGTDNGDGTFAASLAFVFTHGCNSRNHGDGGQGEDGDG